MARRHHQRGRDVNGVLLLDKPVGITSNAALQEVKRLFKARKAGHTGSLDPLAGGLLPVCFGEATKLSAFLLDADKIYQGVCKLGERTSTGDAEGEVIETREVPALEVLQVHRVLEQFTGELSQTPPMHSAIKYQGKPLYKLAHQGIEVDRKPRQVHIFEIRMVRLEGDRLEFFVHCSKGTYIRTLAEDIGAALGCGAHLVELRRLGVGPFHGQDAVPLSRIKELAERGTEALDALLIPMAEALRDWPQVRLTANSAYYMRQGQPVLVPQAPVSGWVRLFTEDERFMGVGRVLDDGRIAPKRLVHAG